MSEAFLSFARRHVYPFTTLKRGSTYLFNVSLNFHMTLDNLVILSGNGGYSVQLEHCKHLTSGGSRISRRGGGAWTSDAGTFR